MNYGKYTAIVSNKKLVIVERVEGQSLAKTTFEGEFKSHEEAVAHIDKFLTGKPGSVTRIVS